MLQSYEWTRVVLSCFPWAMHLSVLYFSIILCTFVGFCVCLGQGQVSCVGLMTLDPLYHETSLIGLLWLNHEGYPRLCRAHLGVLWRTNLFEFWVATKWGIRQFFGTLLEFMVGSYKGSNSATSLGKALKIKAAVDESLEFECHPLLWALT